MRGPRNQNRPAQQAARQRWAKAKQNKARKFRQSQDEMIRRNNQRE